MKNLTFAALFIAPAQAATCSGGANCRACKTCAYCKHCAKEGGTCSVCHSYEAPKTSKARQRELEKEQRDIRALIAREQRGRGLQKSPTKKTPKRTGSKKSRR